MQGPRRGRAAAAMGDARSVDLDRGHCVRQHSRLSGGQLGKTASEHDQLLPHVTRHRRPSRVASRHASCHDRRNFRLLSSRAESVRDLGNDGRSVMYGLHLAHVHDVNGSLLYDTISDSVRSKQDEEDDDA